MPKRRPAGDGMLRKRKDGTWEGRIVVGHKENGSSIFKSVYAKTQKELMPKLHAMIEQVREQIAEEKAAIKAAAESAEGQ